MKFMNYSSQETHSNRKDIQMSFLDKSKSRKHTEILQNIMKESYRKQSGSSYDLKNSDSNSARKMMQVSKLNVDTVKDHSKSNEVPDVPQQSQETSTTKKQRKFFQFNIIWYLIEVIFAYGLAIGIGYLYKLHSFPYYLVLVILAIAISIQPKKISTLLLVFAAVPIAIVNNYIGTQILTYPSILICYAAVLLFNEKHKVKTLILVVLVIELLFGFLAIPGFYSLFKDKSIFYYLFPIPMILIRSILSLLYWLIGYSSIVFLQFPFFINGFEIGIILTLSINDMQFWYLIIFYTLGILNDRTQFIMTGFAKIVSYFSSYQKQQQKLTKNKNFTFLLLKRGILVQQISGYNCIHSLHLLILVYIYSYLPIYTTPFNSSFAPLESYVRNNQGFKPVVVWILGSVYEIMSLVLFRKNKMKMIIGFLSHRVIDIIQRTLMLVLGFWFFYLGLGIGNYMLKVY